ncbi:MAG TPA: dephospho-CoA kinase [Polyangiaceae bacterium]|nr:dephospho-CoA kinase [Polyangiaceae bacterium]
MPSRIFALTGGIASGKSTVAEFLREAGIPVVDADSLARELVEPGQPALARIAEAFGEEVLDSTGGLDRARLGQRVFADASERARLEAILHPLIRAEAALRFARLEEAGHDWIAYDVPLLFETNQAERFRPVVVVVAPPAARAARAEARDGGGAERFAARLAAQWPLEDKAARADYVIDNSGTREETRERTLAVVEALRNRVAPSEAH